MEQHTALTSCQKATQPHSLSVIEQHTALTSGYRTLTISHKAQHFTHIWSCSSKLFSQLVTELQTSLISGNGGSHCTHVSSWNSTLDTPQVRAAHYTHIQSESSTFQALPVMGQHIAHTSHHEQHTAHTSRRGAAHCMHFLPQSSTLHTQPAIDHQTHTHLAIQVRFRITCHHAPISASHSNLSTPEAIRFKYAPVQRIDIISLSLSQVHPLTE